MGISPSTLRYLVTVALIGKKSSLGQSNCPVDCTDNANCPAECTCLGDEGIRQDKIFDCRNNFVRITGPSLDEVRDSGGTLLAAPYTCDEDDILRLKFRVNLRNYNTDLRESDLGIWIATDGGVDAFRGECNHYYFFDQNPGDANVPAGNLLQNQDGVEPPNTGTASIADKCGDIKAGQIANSVPLFKSTDDSQMDFVTVVCKPNDNARLRVASCISYSQSVSNRDCENEGSILLGTLPRGILRCNCRDIIFDAINVNAAPSTSPVPSSVPSSEPSVHPSDVPSMQPSAGPSGQPSTDPSSQPSARLSTQPSARPSTQPSPGPSPQPSPGPSPQPSAEPSPQPSAEPSPLPSSGPSLQPSSGPSPQPSSGPSPQPSAEPSGKPSADSSNQLCLGDEGEREGRNFKCTDNRVRITGVTLIGVKNEGGKLLSPPYVCDEDDIVQLKYTMNIRNFNTNFGESDVGIWISTDGGVDAFHGKCDHFYFYDEDVGDSNRPAGNFLQNQDGIEMQGIGTETIMDQCGDLAAGQIANGVPIFKSATDNTGFVRVVCKPGDHLKLRVASCISFSEMETERNRDCKAENNIVAGTLPGNSFSCTCEDLFFDAISVNLSPSTSPKPSLTPSLIPTDTIKYPTSTPSIFPSFGTGGKTGKSKSKERKDWKKEKKGKNNEKKKAQTVHEKEGKGSKSKSKS